MSACWNQLRLTKREGGVDTSVMPGENKVSINFTARANKLGSAAK